MKLSGILDTVMGNFICLRGFASIKGLAKASEVKYNIQRDLIDEHKGEMAAFLNSEKYLFFPEVILSLDLSKGADSFEINEFRETLRVKGSWSKKLGNFNISILNRPYAAGAIHIANIEFNEQKIKLNRIDGNHRLSAATDVRKDYSIPFCILIFDNVEYDEEFSRAIFHNINSKQIPLKLEENLKVIIESENVFTDSELENDTSFGPSYRLTRKLLKNIDFDYFPNINSYISCAKHTFFIELFKFLIDNGSVAADDTSVEVLKSQLNDVENALRETERTSSTNNISIIGAMAYYKITDADKYRHFVNGVKKNHIGDIETVHIDDIIKIYDKIHLNCPRKAFLARWYPAETDAEYTKAEHRLNAIKRVVGDLGLVLEDIGTKDGGTFDIRSVMYHKLSECDIFIADLTGARHNVMVEVGYALKHVNSGRMLFYFQPNENCKAVPFDINGFMYSELTDSADINKKVKPKLESILEHIKSGEL